MRTSFSASGENAALPHYSLMKSSAAMISRDMPYLKWVLFFCENQTEH